MSSLPKVILMDVDGVLVRPPKLYSHVHAEQHSIEADQIDRKDFELSFACLRWKGADPATCDEKGFIIDQTIIVDTNPPSPSHWIAKMEKELAGGAALDVAESPYKLARLVRGAAGKATQFLPNTVI